MATEVINRRIGLGVTLGVDPTGVGTTFTTLGAIVEGVDGPDAKKTVVDVTLLGDKWAVKSVAQSDAGDLTFQIAYDPSDAQSTTVLTGLLTTGWSSATAVNPPAWQIVFPAAGGASAAAAGAAIPTITEPIFYGFVTGFKRIIQKAKLVVAEVTISVSGFPGLTGA